MNKLFLTICCTATVLFLSNCAQNKTPQMTQAERDTAWARLSDEEKRLPQNALLGLEAAEGLEATLFASEPLMGNPTNIDVDSRGRVWVCDAFNYRPQLNPDNPQRAEGDRILILEDLNGDGKADTAKVFYQGNDVNAALGITVLGNKAIVSCSPNVFVFTDTDGDDKADTKEVLFSQLGGVQHDHAIHSFSFGPDGKLYFNFGNEGGQLMDKTGQPLKDKWGTVVNHKGSPFRQGMLFRMNPDGSDLEVLAHNFRNNYEAAVDAFGSIWQSDNDDDGNQSTRINYILEYGNYGYTDEKTGAGWRAHRTNMERDIPARHWHQNDPGSVPNLLVTGAGSPTGMVVYEGNLLPEAYRNQMIHCDAGPNIVRSYPVEREGAGFKASILPVLSGVRDQWFRPSDVCVAPDGSLFISDWYDPGVGGHQMADLNRGRIYRVAPPGSKYSVPKLDLSTAAGAAKALQSPNLATRYLAWQKLHEMGAAAEAALKEMYENEPPRMRARALWLLANLEGKGAAYLDAALADKDPNIRIIALRSIRQNGGDVLAAVAKLAADSDSHVRREAAIALRRSTAPEVAALWAKLAAQHKGNDRWYLEALGIGAEGKWDQCLEAWQKEVGTQDATAGGNDIIWRARSAKALPALAAAITSDATNATDRLRYFRAFDFIDDREKNNVLLALLENQSAEKNRIILTALQHLDPEVLARSPKARNTLDTAMQQVRGTLEFVQLARRYKIGNQNEELLQIALAHPDSSLGVEAANLMLKSGGADLLAKAISSPYPQQSAAALKALSRAGSKEGVQMMQQVIGDPSLDVAIRQEAVKMMAGGWMESEYLLGFIKKGQLPKDLQATAAAALSGTYRKDIRQEALKYLGGAGSKEGAELPPINQLAMQSGNISVGRQVFSTACATCHQVGAEGSPFGPALTQIGAKLPKEALYLAILHPDQGISFGYEGYTVQLKDGSTAAGIISSETATELELSLPGGIKKRYEKGQIASRKKMEHSMMPSGLQASMTRAELVSLVEYLYSLKANVAKQVAMK
ncbi:PVC-type heme-binding CxxCH protein [Paracnuella aquatica]|uniref:PVC-type heme-binding CxxCH protein n=1 Tax=Paracnuella aquatica TaxID=2268757 RepID=UPI000DEF22F6|nr:PVC-type heme-binding CxxCH protein [Paracnuella aquatica]RPD46643.1 dehydrogenase [Paracnuella aquatica]